MEPLNVKAAEEILKCMTFEEKAEILTGSASLKTAAVERLGIEQKSFADGPHGTRLEKEKDCTEFPSLCALGASWNIDAARKMGSSLAGECINNGIDMLLAPGINIKRNILCGRNFEYFSEDPVLSGEMAAAYICGLQEKGVSASLKHFAVNSQEKYREKVSAEIDERTLREIYLKGFEIAVKKSKPDSVMCAYNKVNSIWCSENEYLLKKTLKEEWGYEGMVVSDWGAVQDIAKAVKAGLDLQMPRNPDIVRLLKEGIEQGVITMDEIDRAAERVLSFIMKKRERENCYSRKRQHDAAREIAADCIVMLKNENGILPLTKEKYKKIAVVGEYAVSPLINGQGSAEVYQSEAYTDSPLEELQKRLPGVELVYIEAYKKRVLPSEMVWPGLDKFRHDIKDCDAVVFFAGALESEDTEYFDRQSVYLNPNQSLFINAAVKERKKTAVILQSGGALILDEWNDEVDGLMLMHLAGEAAGGAIADALCGNINPSGKLAETFPNKMRTDLDYPGDGNKVVYKERLDVGYRYYDKHPDEINYPFGFGLSYTEFYYSDISASVSGENVEISFVLKNIGKVDGCEVVQLYVGDRESTAEKPVKELKKFKKVFLMAGEEKQISFVLENGDFAYFNIMLKKWVAENGIYDIYIGSSSRDIRLKTEVNYINSMPYTLKEPTGALIG